MKPHFEQESERESEGAWKRIGILAIDENKRYLKKDLLQNRICVLEVASNSG